MTLLPLLVFAEHLDKNELFSFLELVLAALRPGGRFIIQTINAENPWGLALLYGDLTHEIVFTPGSLAVALRTIGFAQYQARGCPPHVHSVFSLMRKLLWPIFSAAILLESLVETGGVGSSNRYPRFRGLCDQTPRMTCI